MAALALVRQLLSHSARAAGGLQQLPGALALLRSQHVLPAAAIAGGAGGWEQPWSRGLHASSAAWATLHVKVPPLGESITDGTISMVLKQAGDSVEEDEPIVQIETDKVTVDVRSPKAGTVEAILVKEDENVAVGHMIASILERVAGIERPVEATTAPSASTPAAAAPAAPSATRGHTPSIRFPTRRTPEGQVISALPLDQARSLQAVGAVTAPPAAAAAGPPPRPTAAVPLPQPNVQNQTRVTVLMDAPPPPRAVISDQEMELIMLGGAEP